MLPTKQTWRICWVLNEFQKLSVCSVQSEPCRKAEQLHLVTFISVINSSCTLFLHSQGKGGLHISLQIKQLALTFPSFGFLKFSLLYLSGLSLADWQMGSLPASQVNCCWFLRPYLDIISVFQVAFGFAHLCRFTEWVRKQIFFLNKCDWGLNSVLQNSTCKLESLTLKKKTPEITKTAAKA